MVKSPLQIISGFSNWKRLATAVSILGLCGCAFADTSQQPVPAITEDSINLTAKIFLAEFIHANPDRRRIARLYMLGVLDTTEGKSWCSYNILKTVTLNEFVFEYLKKQTAEQLQRRASLVIEEALNKTFPCKDSQ